MLLLSQLLPLSEEGSCIILPSSCQHHITASMLSMPMSVPMPIPISIAAILALILSSSHNRSSSIIFHCILCCTTSLSRCQSYICQYHVRTCSRICVSVIPPRHCDCKVLPSSLVLMVATMADLIFSLPLPLLLLQNPHRHHHPPIHQCRSPETYHEQTGCNVLVHFPHQNVLVHFGTDRRSSGSQIPPNHQ
jgi:hypothetical protein